MASKTASSETPYGFLCQAVGFLFLQWAKLENEMAAALRLHLYRQIRSTSKSGELASAVYGSMRMKASRDTMKRMAQELDYGEKALAFHREFFMQIGHIEDFRDKLAHWVIESAHEEEDDWWQVTDILTTRTYRSVKEYEFHVDAVVAASEDLYSATQTIGAFLSKGARRSAPKLPTWRYKPSMLKLQMSNMPPSPPTRRRPPRSSQEK